MTVHAHGHLKHAESPVCPVLTTVRSPRLEQPTQLFSDFGVGPSCLCRRPAQVPPSSSQWSQLCRVTQPAGLPFIRCSRTRFSGFRAAEVAGAHDDAFAALHREHQRRTRQGEPGVGWQSCRAAHQGNRCVTSLHSLESKLWCLRWPALLSRAVLQAHRAMCWPRLSARRWRSRWRVVRCGWRLVPRSEALRRRSSCWSLTSSPQKVRKGGKRSLWCVVLCSVSST